MNALPALLLLLLVPVAAAGAQSAHADATGVAPADVAAGASEMLLRAPDADVDRLFRAVHAASREDAEARGLCALFEPDADRSLAGLQRAAGALGEASRVRLVEALAGIAISGLQGVRQPYDPAAGAQALKAATVTAMMLHDGFGAALAGTGRDDTTRRARCTAFRQLVDVLDGFDRPRRVAATRYLLAEGLAQYGGGS